MNQLKVLLLVIVSTGLACSAFAIERTRNLETPALAVERIGNSNGAADALIAAAPEIELGVPVKASLRLAGAAAVQYAAADVNRIGARAAGSTGSVAAPGTGRSSSAAPGGSRFPQLTMPEPAEWMQLLCGLVVAGFIARRRTSLVHD